MTKEELNRCIEICYEWKKNNPDGESAHNELQIVALELLRDENINIEKLTIDMLIYGIDDVLDGFRNSVRMLDMLSD